MENRLDAKYIQQLPPELSQEPINDTAINTTNVTPTNSFEYSDNNVGNNGNNNDKSKRNNKLKFGK